MRIYSVFNTVCIAVIRIYYSSSNTLPTSHIEFTSAVSPLRRMLFCHKVGLVVSPARWRLLLCIRVEYFHIVDRSPSFS